MTEYSKFFLHEGTGEKLIQKRVEFNNVAKKYLDSCQIIFCTLSKAASLSVLFNDNKPAEGKVLIRDLFKYAIVDEASQTAEMNTLSVVRPITEKVILVGDHKQLEPVILDRNAQRF